MGYNNTSLSLRSYYITTAGKTELMDSKINGRSIRDMSEYTKEI